MLARNQKSMAFMMNVNNPKVIIFIGNVKTTKIGLKIRFTTPSNSATTSAV